MPRSREGLVGLAEGMNVSSTGNVSSAGVGSHGLYLRAFRNTRSSASSLSLTFLIASIIVTVSPIIRDQGSFMDVLSRISACIDFSFHFRARKEFVSWRSSAFNEAGRRSGDRCRIKERRAGAQRRLWRVNPRSIATNPMLLPNSITSCLASVSSPDVKMTVRGLFGEKSSIQAIDMLLIDLTSRAPTGSTRPSPRRPSHEIASSARLRGTSFRIRAPGQADWMSYLEWSGERR